MSRESLFVACPGCGATSFIPSTGPTTSTSGLVVLGEWRRCACCDEEYFVPARKAA